MLQTTENALPATFANPLTQKAERGPAECFDRTQVINLVDRKDRLREITSELTKLGMSFANPRVKLFAAERCTQANGFPSPGVRGCFLSHLAILSQAKADGLRNLLIIEDDLTVTPAFKEHCSQLLEQADTGNWGFIYFGHRVNASAPEVPRLFQYDGPIATTHFYAVNKTVFDPLIDYLQAVQLRAPGDPAGGPMHYDGALTMFRAAHPDIKTLIAEPSLGSQRSSRSDIHGNWYDKVWGLRHLADAARAGKRKL